MYFVNTRKKLTSNTFLLHTLPAGTVLITVLGLTLLGWRNANQAYRGERQAAINNTVNETKSGITDKFDSYRLVLLGASGLFLSSDEVTRDEWDKFVGSFNIDKNYPGVQGVGYMQRATRSELPNLVSEARADGYQNFRIHPLVEGPEYDIVKYFVPEHAPGLGYNMFAHPARKSAIAMAQQTGEATISDKVVYTETEMPFSGVGFSMYLPVNQSSAEQNRKPTQRKVQGFVFAPFLANEFFIKAREYSRSESHGLRIYDGKVNNKNLLFESSRFGSLDNEQAIKHTVPLELFGQQWILDFRFSPDIVAKSTQNRPTSSLVVGIMLSFLLSGFVLSLLVARTRVLAHSKQLEVQNAKDELLSLASHQLRTPATSVKQYLGMVLEGFVGKLSVQQKSLLEKAYESNERQLHIINEILYVAKIDAKGIVLTPRRISTNKLLRNLSQELSTTAKKTQQKIRLQMPMRQVYVEADEHCLRMALENLISNALKYSYEGSTVSVKLTTTKDMIKVTVKDRGVGIDSEDLSMLFQRFSRIPNELSQQTSGSGIGLYLSQQLIELHSGKIEVESTKGKGTTFTVTIPKTYTPNSART
jgi:signal transduction histidine kinase